jgi:hypothetical protein
MGNACPFQSQVGAYHDGELADVAARSALERHLVGCATCADDLAWLRRVSATLARPGAGGDDDDVLSSAALDRFHGAIDAEAGAADAARLDIRRFYRAAAALSAFAASILVLSCTWLNTLSAPPSGRGARGLTNPPEIAITPADAWERVALSLRIDPRPAGGPNGDVYLADAGDGDSLADWMLHGLGATGAEATR